MASSDTFSAGEYEAATQGLGVVDFSNRGLLAITGPDRASFLHGMCTQEIEALKPSQAAYAAFLTAKGGMVGDARVLCLDDALWLDTEPGQGTVLLSHLSRFLISEEAEISDLSHEWALVSLLGPQSAQVAVPEKAVLSSHFVPGIEGVDVFVKREGLSQALASFNATPVSRQTWNTLRIEAGVPKFGEDMGPTTLPMEARLERALSYDKGCYIGQEVVARGTFRGHMNRLLTGFLLGPTRLEAGTEVFAGEKKAGWVTSVTYSPKRQQWVALGYAHRDFLEPGTVLALKELGSTVTVCPLPF